MSSIAFRSQGSALRVITQTVVGPAQFQIRQPYIWLVFEHLLQLWDGVLITLIVHRPADPGAARFAICTFPWDRDRLASPLPPDLRDSDVM